jgi:hypothetical protein
MDKRYKNTISYDCCDNSYTQTSYKEGSAYEIPSGTYQFHSVDDKPTAVYTEMNGVVDEAYADDGEHDGDGQ